MIGIWTKRENIARLDNAERQIARLRRKRSLTEAEQLDLEHWQENAEELRQWLTDLARIEG